MIVKALTAEKLAEKLAEARQAELTELMDLRKENARLRRELQRLRKVKSERKGSRQSHSILYNRTWTMLEVLDEKIEPTLLTSRKKLYREATKKVRRLL